MPCVKLCHNLIFEVSTAAGFGAEFWGKGQGYD